MANSTLDFIPLLTETQPSGAQIAHHAVLNIKKASVSMVNPEIVKSTIDDSSIALPVTVNLTEHSNINFFMIYGVYKDDDPPAGIVSGDYAPIEVELNNSGIFVPVKTMLVLGGAINALKYKKSNSDTRKVLVVRMISATGI